MRLVLSLVVFAMAVTLSALAQPRQPVEAMRRRRSSRCSSSATTPGTSPRIGSSNSSPCSRPGGIELTYTDKLDDLNAKNLANYDGLIIYANHTKISPEQEKRCSTYVASGKGFIPTPLRVVLLPELAEVHRAGRRPVPHATAPARSAPRS